MTRVPGLLFGGDYNAEQWPEEMWPEDAALMHAAGVNLVTVGVFGWSRLEPAEGVYAFDWLDRLLDVLHEHSIAVDLATATASPPAWLVRRYPEMLPVTADGVRLEFGSRQHYCPSSPVFRQAAARLVERLADRYQDHPAVAMWHIHNEYGDHVTECFCPISAADFRSWLRRRYRTLDALNSAWGTAFWSQHYSDWSHLEPPRTAPGPRNPTQQLDWQRFSSDALLECYRAEKSVLDRYSGAVPVTTNFMSMFRSLDYWAMAAEEDVVSDDAYPDPADPQAHVHAAMNYDLMRSLRHGAPWLLMEHAASAVSWRPVNVPKSADLSRLWSLQTVARGADGVLFFQWRASVAGAEKFHSALLPHRGTSSRGWAQTTRLGADLQRLAEVADSRVPTEVAVVLDWHNWWALELDEHPSSRMRWLDIVRAWYEPLYTRNLPVRFVPPGADLTGVRLVLAPNLYLCEPDTAHWLARYVDGGGHLVVGPFSGVVDRDDRVHHGGAPGPLEDLLGIAVDEWWPLADGAVTRLAAADDDPDRYRHATTWAEWVEAGTADPIARYADGELASVPAITRNHRGGGTAWYVGCGLDSPGLDTLLGDCLDAANVTRGRTPRGVEAVRRLGADAEYLFLLNHNTEPATVGQLSPAGVDLLTGRPSGSEIELPARGAAVLRRPLRTDMDSPLGMDGAVDRPGIGNQEGRE
ncbi:beta-galactosidase [Saccharopolyspora shandongensis]|uniref:beta-galactosidase n=1 Tax=Saccharopolyspora shandongensis TaxID=418495 RepID=UPI0034262785